MTTSEFHTIQSSSLRCKHVKMAIIVALPWQDGYVNDILRFEKRQLVSRILSALHLEALSWTTVMEHACVTYGTSRLNKFRTYPPMRMRRQIDGVQFVLTVSIAVRIALRESVVKGIMQSILKTDALTLGGVFPPQAQSDTDLATQIREDVETSQLAKP